MKLKKIISFFILTQIFLFENSFSQSWQWAVNGGGINSDKGTDIAIDASGQLYASGYYNVGQPAFTNATFGTISAPTSTLFAGWGKEGFVAKVSSSGVWTWPS